jgi:hypothetical protein
LPTLSGKLSSTSIKVRRSYSSDWQIRYPLGETSDRSSDLNSRPPSEDWFAARLVRFQHLFGDLIWAERAIALFRVGLRGNDGLSRFGEQHAEVLLHKGINGLAGRCTRRRAEGALCEFNRGRLSAIGVGDREVGVLCWAAAALVKICKGCRQGATAIALELKPHSDQSMTWY